MNLYNVLLNNKISFVLLESNENIIYCKSYTDYLFNVGVFKTKTKEVILEYNIVNEEKYVTADVTFESGDCYKNVKFKIIVDEKSEVPYSSINLSNLNKKIIVNLPPRQEELIEEVTEQEEINLTKKKEPIEELPDYTKKVEEALSLQRQLQQEKIALDRQKIILEKQNILDKKLQEYKQELLEEYFNATKKQGEALDYKVQQDLKILEDDLRERIVNTFHEYQIEFQAKDKNNQQDSFNKLLVKIEDSISKNRQEIDQIISDKILLESDENRKKLEEQSKLLNKNYNDKLLVELEKYKTELFEDFKTVSHIELSKVVADSAPELFNKIQQIDDKVKKIVEEKNKSDESDKFTSSQQKYVNDTAQYWARRILELGGGGGSVAQQFAHGGTMEGNLNVNGTILSGGKDLSSIFITSEADSQNLLYNENNYNLSISSGNTVNLSSINSTLYSNSANWSSVYSTVKSLSDNWEGSQDITVLQNSVTQIAETSANWNSTYTTVKDNSSYWADTRNDITFDKNVTINGNLTALGTSTFKSTVFTTTSALSVINTGPGPALYVFQAAGSSDVASFYDGDGIEVLHVGNAQGGGNPLGKVGINTSNPTVEFTVNGQISANNIITAAGGNSNQWNSNFTTTNSNSANWSSVYTTVQNNSAGWESVESSVSTTSGNWNSVYSTTNANSSKWESNWTTTNSNSANWILDGGNIKEANISIGTNDGYRFSLETNNTNRVTILSTGEVIINQLPIVNGVVGSLSSIGNALDICGTAAVYSEISSLTGLSALSGSSPGQFSAGGMLIGQNEGGAYLGRIGVRENSWQVLSGTEGVSWVSRATSQLWQGVAMSSDGRIQTAIVYNGNIWTSYDYGVTWTSKATSQLWYSVAMSSDGRIQTAVVYSGNIWTSYDYGVTWIARASSRSWSGIAMSSDGRIQTAVVINGNIWTSYDYGVTWVRRATSQPWQSVAMSSDGRIQTAVMYGGNIRTSYDYGVTWVSRATSQQWYGIAMSSDGRIQTAVVYNGNIWTSYDYGVTWTSRATSGNWQGIAMSSDGRIQTAVIFNSNIWTSYDYGVTWTSRATSLFWYGVAMSSDGRIQTAVADGNNIWTSYATTVTPNPITVLGTISATDVIYASGGNSNQWNNNRTTTNNNSGFWSEAYTNLVTNSATYLLSGSNAIIEQAYILQSTEQDLSASVYSLFLKSVTAENVFTYNGFTSGRTITIFLSASHSGVIGHYFPLNTYFNNDGNANLLYTFEGYTTRAIIQNTGNYYFGSTQLIPTQVNQYDKSLGDAILQEDGFGFIVQEDNDRILQG